MSKISGLFFTSIAAAALSLALVGGPAYAGDIVGPHHQDQHQSLLRQDEGRLRGQGQGTRPDASGLRRQVRRRQRWRGQSDRAADRPPAPRAFCWCRAIRRRSCRRSRRPATPASSSSRSTRRSIRSRAADANFATDNFKAGELIGEWAKATLGDKADERQDRHARPRPQPADGRLSAPQRLPHRLRHSGQGSEALRHERQPADRRLRRDAGRDRRRPQGDGEYPPEGRPHRPRLRDQRAGGYGGYAALKAAGKEKGVTGRRGRRRLPGRQVGQGRHHRRDFPAISAADGGRRRRGGRRVHQDRQEAAEHRHRREAGDRSSRSGVPSITRRGGA